MCDVYCNTRCCHIVDCVISAFLINISFLNAHLAWCQKISLGIWTIVIKFYSQSLARGKGVVITDWVLAHVINHPLRLLNLSCFAKYLAITWFYLYSENLYIYSIYMFSQLYARTVVAYKKETWSSKKIFNQVILIKTWWIL